MQIYGLPTLSRQTLNTQPVSANERVTTTNVAVGPNSSVNPNSSTDSGQAIAVSAPRAVLADDEVTLTSVIPVADASPPLSLQNDNQAESIDATGSADDSEQTATNATAIDSEDEPLSQEDQNANSAGVRGQDGELLSEAEQRQVVELKARDAEVRAHERAHKAVGGQYAGSISYTYQQGPDGRRYAIGGEVPIDASPIPGDPQATIDKLTIVKAAALAPAEPSSQDRNVAAQASQGITEARSDLNAQRLEEISESRESDDQEDSSNASGRSSELGIEAYTQIATALESVPQQSIDQRV